MKTKKPLLKPLILVASAMVWCGLNLHAQPVITNQPASQTNLPGTTVSFSVAVNGTGPFTYQWRFNGTNLPNNLITTVAGNGSRTYSGDNGTAINASLYYPSGVAFDNSGNLCIADYENNRIRKVSTNGIITTVAGNGTGGYSGDGGKATNASLHSPYGVAFDAFGNLFIADNFNHRIRKVSTNGIITTVAGNGTGTYAGDGGAATNASLDFPNGVAFDAADNLYIADAGNERIRKVDTNGVIISVAGNGIATYAGDGGAATNASLHYPAGVAFDAAGNLDIADGENNRIRKVDTNGNITTVAGNGTGTYAGDGGAATNASLSYPSGLALDAAGNLYIADYLNNRIREVLFSAVNPTFSLANVSITNAGNYTVVITSSSGSVTSAVATLTIATPPVIIVQPASQIAGVGSSPSFSVAAFGSGPLSYQWYLSLPTRAGAVAQIINGFTVGATVTNGGAGYTTAPQVRVVGGGGSGAGGYATVSKSGTVIAITMTNAGYGYTNLPLIQIDPPIQYLSRQTYPVFYLNAVRTNNAGNYFVTVKNNYGSVTSLVATLTVALPPKVTTQPASQTNLAGTDVSFSVAATGIGSFDYQWQFNGTNLASNVNIITTVAGNGTATYAGDGGAATSASLDKPAGVVLDAAGNLYVADQANNRIRKVNFNGISLSVVGNGYKTYAGDGGAATNASLNGPFGVTFDAFGNTYIADTGNNRIRKVDTYGIIITVAGNGISTFAGDGGAATSASLAGPTGVTFDAFGNMYIADTANDRIRKVDTNGIITTVVGNGIFGFSGDGAAATNASLYLPYGGAFDASGNLYIPDEQNNRIRKVDTNGIITTVAGNGNHGCSGDNGAATNASLFNPKGVALDASGNLYISDWINNRIRKVDTNGIITTVAGNGNNGYSGDGGAATNASLNEPLGIAFDTAGNMYIADWQNNRIREVHFGGYTTFALTSVNVTNAGNYTVVISSPYGSVTSVVATLTVTVPRTPPQIIASGASLGFVSNQFGFNFSGAVGQMIVIDGSTNLVDWTPLITNTAGGTPIYFFDPTSTNFSGRFYRARLSP